MKLKHLKIGGLYKIIDPNVFGWISPFMQVGGSFEDNPYVALKLGEPFVILEERKIVTNPEFKNSWLYHFTILTTRGEKAEMAVGQDLLGYIIEIA